jgi:hypothetical protein
LFALALFLPVRLLDRAISAAGGVPCTNRQWLQRHHHCAKQVKQSVERRWRSQSQPGAQLHQTIICPPGQRAVCRPGVCAGGARWCRASLFTLLTPLPALVFQEFKDTVGLLLLLLSRAGDRANPHSSQQPILQQPQDAASTATDTQPCSSRQQGARAAQQQQQARGSCGPRPGASSSSGRGRSASDGSCCSW